MNRRHFLDLTATATAASVTGVIIADGLRWGCDPVPSVANLGIAQSTRGYDPMRISHCKAS